MNEQVLVWDERKKVLKALVDQALQEALPEAEVDEYQANVNRVTADFLAEKADLEAYGKATELDQHLPGLVKVKTLTEYRYVMECAGFTEEEITKTLAHENDHRLAVEEVEGARSQYMLLCMTTNDGRVFRPSLYTAWPDGIPAKEFSEELRASISAPEHLSECDIAQLSKSNSEASP